MSEKRYQFRLVVMTFVRPHRVMNTVTKCKWRHLIQKLRILRTACRLACHGRIIVFAIDN